MGQALQQIYGGVEHAMFQNDHAMHSGPRETLSGTAQPRVYGKRALIVTARWDSPVGPLWAAANEAGVCLLEFDQPARREAQVRALQRWVGGTVAPGENEHLTQLWDELRGYFAGRLKAFRVPLVYPGTAFQRRVWEALLRIPYGETRSYEEVACAIGAPTSCRAVARANASNRIAIVIPCHRVVNKNGQLGGYGGEVWRKRFLLELEGATGGGRADHRAARRVFKAG